MLLNLIVGDYSMNLEIPPHFLNEADELYSKMDKDMDAGWQLGKDWIKNPDPLQRCQIAADKLLDALETDNHSLALIAAGYILHRMPNVRRVHIDNNGEPTATEFFES